ncbi:MAG: periplasmic heavy metal sensor [Spirochaetes bacterium]|nr:MAG: periplasmic heavy metal sensor [Spirochaetota bacterium]
MKRSTRFIAVASVIAVAGLAFAGCAHHWSPEKRADYMAKKIASKLDLNDEQKAKLYAIKDEAVAKFKEERAGHKAMRAEAIALVKKDKVERAEVEKLFSEREEHMKRLRPFIIDKIIEFHAILTPEQRAKAAELMEEFQKKME